MNPQDSNPLMFILEADPDRYINTPAATLLTVLKMAEGAAAFMCCWRIFNGLRFFAGQSLNTLLYDVPARVLPLGVMQWLRSAVAPLNGTMGTALGCAVEVCVLALLACLAAEAVAAVLLRFAKKGAMLFKLTRRVVLAASFVLLACAAVACVPLVLGAFGSGFQMSASLRLLLMLLPALLLLFLYFSYSRGASTVMTAVEYEIRLGFKETGVKNLRLGLDAFLLGLLFLAGGAALFFLARPRITRTQIYGIAALAFLALKFFTAGQSWDNFRRRHR